MRYYTLFIIFLCTSYCFSQQYEVRISDFDYRAHTKRDRCKTNEMWLDIHLKDGNEDRVITSSDGTTMNNKSIIKTYYSGISSINFHSFIHSQTIGDWWRPIKSCNGPSVGIDKNIPIEKDCIEKTLYIDSKQDENFIGENASTSILFYYEINPVTKLIQTSYEIGYNDYLTLEIDNDSKNLPSELFRYQFILVSNSDPNDWKDLPAEYQGRKNPKIRLRDFLSNNVIKDKIRIKTIRPCGGRYAPENEKEVFYEIKNSLPILKNDNNDVIITNCYGDEANYTLRFDRPLKEGEKMFFNIKGVNVGNPDPFTYELDSLEKGNTLTFKNLKAGTYAVSYLGNGSANAYTPYTEGHPFIFTIKNPDPVEFYIEDLTDIQNPFCFQNSDGSITITARGGNNSYQIKINNEEWTDFSNRRKHTFSNLSEGTYTISVRDVKGCVGKVLDRNRNRETMEVKLKSPLPIKVSYPPELQIRPKFSNATQGRITAVVEGGTVLPYFQGYIFYWERRDENTIEEITSQVITSYDTENRKFYIIANNIPKGDYYLMAYDINYYNHPMV